VWSLNRSRGEASTFSEVGAFLKHRMVLSDEFHHVVGLCTLQNLLDEKRQNFESVYDRHESLF
jgi:hypothetical protein